MDIWGNINFGFTYIAAFIVGLIILILFCVDRFAQPVKNESFVSKLLPAHLASKHDYLKAFLVYLFIMLSIYTALSLVGPSFYQAINSEQTSNIETGIIGYMPSSNIGNSPIEAVFSDFAKVDAPAWLPLLLMLILTGASTQYKVLNQVELIVRKITHRIIGIPDGIEQLAQNISEAKLSVESFNHRDQKFVREKYKDVTGLNLPDVKEYYKILEDKTPIRRWIRLNFLFDRLENKSEALGDFIDVKVLSYYKEIWNTIKVSVFELKDKSVLDSLNEMAGDDVKPNSQDKIKKITDSINETLHDMHALIAATIASRCQRAEFICESMAELGLSCKDAKRSDLINAVIFAIFLMSVVVFLIVFFTTRIPGWFDIILTKPYPILPIDAFKWASAATFLHGSATLAAWYHREKRAKTRDWEDLHLRELKIPALQYFFLVLRCYLVSTFSLFVWWLILEMISPGPLPEITLEMIWIPFFGLVGACTGFWVSYTIDLTVNRTSSKKRKSIQPFLQAFFTALLCYFVMTMLSGVSLHTNERFNLYVSAVMGLEGLTIGYAVLLITQKLNIKKEAS